MLPRRGGGTGSAGWTRPAGLIVACLGLVAAGPTPAVAQGRVQLRATATVVVAATPAPDSLVQWLRQVVRDEGGRWTRRGGAALPGGSDPRGWVATLTPQCGPRIEGTCGSLLTISFPAN